MFVICSEESRSRQTERALPYLWVQRRMRGRGRGREERRRKRTMEHQGAWERGRKGTRWRHVHHDHPMILFFSISSIKARFTNAVLSLCHHKINTVTGISIMYVIGTNGWCTISVKREYGWRIIIKFPIKIQAPLLTRKRTIVYRWMSNRRYRGVRMQFCNFL